MASQQPTNGSAPKTLLVRGRLKTPGQMNAFVHDTVGLHLLGQVAETSPSIVLQAQYTEGRQVWVFGAVLCMQEARSRLMK